MWLQGYDHECGYSGVIRVQLQGCGQGCGYRGVVTGCGMKSGATALRSANIGLTSNSYEFKY